MTNGKGTPTTNERSRPTLAGAVWVRIGRDTNARWPEWKRRWLVLADGTVLVPAEISRDRCTEAENAIRDGAVYAICNGHVLVDSAYAAAHRPADAAAELRAAVDRVLQAAR
jgi:hypothetical protein